jgi:sugar phosphate isomerase/epimerase
MTAAFRRSRVSSSDVWRLGSTSYVYRGDLVDNARRLAGTVQDIELVLFDLDSGESNLPAPAEARELRAIAEAHGLTYTVHLPLDLCGAQGHLSLIKAQKVVECCASLSPFAYVFHLDGEGVGDAAWIDQARRAVEMLIGIVGDAERLTLENLENYAPEHLLPIYDALPIKRALDVGHVWKMGRDALPLLDDWLPHTRVIHLHGYADGRDHLPLTVTPPAVLDALLKRLAGWDGVLTLEVFEDDFFASRVALEAALGRIAKKSAFR